MGGEVDAALVARVRAGDVAAFADLYRAHAPAVAVAVRANLTGSDAVADAVQEAFARALERLDLLRDPTRFRPWILAIARNLAIDEIRHRQRLRGDVAEADEPVSNDASPDTVAELRDLVRTVRGCVAGLSRRDATALVLVSEMGFGPAEVGAALGISTGAAKVAVHRARRRLQAAIELQALVGTRAASPPRSG